MFLRQAWMSLGDNVAYMLSYLCLAAIPLLVGLVAQEPAPQNLNYIVNGGFENGLTGWTVSGDAGIEKELPIAGGSSLRLGPGKGAVSQQYAMAGLHVVEFAATARLSSDKVKAIVRVQCLDANGHVVMDLKQPFAPKETSKPQGGSAKIYFKTHALTKSVLVSIEKTTASSGFVVADYVELHDNDHDWKAHTPTCDLAEYMHPIWHGDRVVDESVLLLSANGGAAAGKLLFKPRRILSLTNTDLSTTFKEGLDFVVDGRTIVAKTDSAIPVVRDSEIPKLEFPWLSVAGRHVLVTYEHDDPWQGPIPPFCGDQLPRTLEKLKSHRPVTIVAYGDSITQGIDVSGYRQAPPYMPTWPDLVAWQLKKVYGYDGIKLFNASLGGMTSWWAADNARDAVGSLKPDLVFVGFGMNDFWSVSPAEFRTNIEGTMTAVRSRSPKAEFILISSIRFDPAYTADPTYVGHMTGYHDALKTLAGKGVCLLDLTALSEYLYAVKSAKDLLADPMHPDDFFARLFAQCAVQMLEVPNMGKRVN